MRLLGFTISVLTGMLLADSLGKWNTLLIFVLVFNTVYVGIAKQE